MNKIPNDFCCPISNKFMSDPVIHPLSNLTCDRSSLQSSESLPPNLILRQRIQTWFSHFTQPSPFAFISTSHHLFLAINSLTTNPTPSITDIRDLKTTLHHPSRATLLETRGLWCMAKILARSNLEPGFAAVAISIVAQVHDVNLPPPSSMDTITHDEYFEMMANIAKTCEEGNEFESDFETGLVNLWRALVEDPGFISIVKSNMTQINQSVRSFDVVMKRMVALVSKPKLPVAETPVYIRLLTTLGV